MEKTKFQTLANAEEQHLAASSISSNTVTTSKTTKKLISSHKTTLKTTKSVSMEASDATASTTVEQRQQQQVTADTHKVSSKKKSTNRVAATEALEQATTSGMTDLQSTSTAESLATTADASDAAKASEITTSQNKKKNKSKKSKKQESDNISVKSSFSKFDALQKRNLIHVRSSDAGKAQEKFSNPQGETKESNCRLCSKPVYKMEEIKAEKCIYHANCFRCRECNKQLKLDNYQSHEGLLYCMVHFKLLFAPKFVEDAEPEKPRKPELIIRENQPIELPPGIVRASDKPDLGLEELQQLNVRSRFQVFENATAQQQQKKDELAVTGATTVKRSTSILSKLAKLQALGITSNISIEHAEQLEEEEAAEENSQNAGSDSAQSEDDGDLELVRSKKRTQRERPIGLGHAMNDIKTKFEKGHMLSKEERREERKQEIQNIRSRLFMGKQARIKEMYQQAVADSEQAIISADRKPEIEIGTAARSIKERFEKGEMFGTMRGYSEEEQPGNARSSGAPNDESEVFESAISKKSRSIFVELDANVAADNKQRRNAPGKVSRTASIVSNNHKYNNSESEQENQTAAQQQQQDVVKCDEKPEDIQIATSEISEKFKFFETYRPTESLKKAFRITPPREGVVKMPTPPESDAETTNNKEDTNLIEKSQTTSRMLSKFREIEQIGGNGINNNGNTEPKPLKCFTPPPDGGKRYYQQYQDDSDLGSQEDEDDDDDDDDDEDFGIDERYRRNRFQANDDEALKEAQAAARAKQLRAKFERWEANEKQRELNEGRVDIYSQQVSDDSTIESTKTIRERFENMKSVERKSPTAPRYQVNRFV